MKLLNNYQMEKKIFFALKQQTPQGIEKTCGVHRFIKVSPCKNNIQRYETFTLLATPLKNYSSFSFLRFNSSTSSAVRVSGGRDSTNCSHSESLRTPEA